MSSLSKDKNDWGTLNPMREGNKPQVIATPYIFPEAISQDLNIPVFPLPYALSYA
jgi:hypothetical protein